MARHFPVRKDEVENGSAVRSKAGEAGLGNASSVSVLTGFARQAGLVAAVRWTDLHCESGAA